MTKHDAVLWYSFGSIKSLRYLFPPLHNASGPKPGGASLWEVINTGIGTTRV